MTFVIYNKNTTILIGNKDGYATEAAAKAALTRMENRAEYNRQTRDYLKNLNPSAFSGDLYFGDTYLSFFREDYAVADKQTFHATIEQSKVVKNLLSGVEIRIPVNTPLCCDPSSETYHSM